MKKLLLFLIALYSNQFAFSQNQLDSIFTSNGNIAVNIKEITEDAIKFTYQGEELVNSIYKNTVSKIKHKSGRIEQFNESSSFKEIKGGDDWEKVSITRIENELKGLFKLEEVTSKATGTTVFSNVNTVKDRAYKKLKIEAAMLGGNIIYILEQQTQGVSHHYGGSDPARTNLSGVAYSNVRPNINEFKKLINLKNEFNYLERQYLGNNSTDLEKDTYLNQKMIEISDVRNDNGFIMVKTNLRGEDTEEYRVTYFDDEKIILMYRDKRKIYNFVLKR
jgi:hypothetical protein